MNDKITDQMKGQGVMPSAPKMIDHRIERLSMLTSRVSEIRHIAGVSADRVFGCVPPEVSNGRDCSADNEGSLAAMDQMIDELAAQIEMLGSNVDRLSAI